MKRTLPEGIYQRGNVLWVKVYEAGRPIQKSAGTPDVKEAVRFRDQLRAQAGRGELGDKLRMGAVTIAELVRDDLARMERECKAATVRWATRVFDNHILAAFGALTAPELTTDLLEAYQHDRLHDGCEKATINNELALLRSALYTGYRRTPPKVERVMSFPMYAKSQLTVRTGYIEWHEYERMLELVDPSIKTLLVILFHCGLRKSEALGLKWDQIEFPNRERCGVVRLKPLETKSHEARTCPMWGDMLPYLARQKEIRDALFPAQPYVFFWMPESYAVGQGGGIRVTPGTTLGGAGGNFKATKSWETAAAAIGKPGLLMHDMRRSAVRNMLERAGLTEGQAMSISGHKTRSMIERYHIIGQAEVDAASKKLETMYARERQQQGPPTPPAGVNVIRFEDLKRKAVG